jgi:hypothetical protein
MILFRIVVTSSVTLIRTAQGIVADTSLPLAGTNGDV